MTKIDKDLTLKRIQLDTSIANEKKSRDLLQSYEKYAAELANEKEAWELRWNKAMFQIQVNGPKYQITGFQRTIAELQTEVLKKKNVVKSLNRALFNRNCTIEELEEILAEAERLGYIQSEFSNK